MYIHDLSQLLFSFSGVVVSADAGWGEGGALLIEQQNPNWGYKEGVGGVITRYRIMKKITKLTLTLSSKVPTVALLSSFIIQDDAAQNGAGVGLITIKDTGGTFSLVDPQGWIEGPPASRTFTDEASDVEFVLWAPNPLRKD